MADAVNDTRTPNSQTSFALSRRKILAGLPAAVCVTALAAPACAGAAHPDAALLAIEPELKVLNEQFEIANEAWGAAEEAYAAACRALPKKQRNRQANLYYLRTNLRVDEARDASHAAAHRVNARYDDFTNARATTLDGLKAKARKAEDSEAIPPSIVRDLLAM